MKDKGLNKIAYILNQKPWLDGADVTMDGVIVTLIIPLQCELANDCINKMIESYNLKGNA